MANELTVSASLKFSKSGRSVDKAYSGIQIDVTGDKWVFGIQEIGTAAEAIDIGDLGTPGFFIGKNLDATNFLEIRDGAAGADVVKMKAGEPALFRLTTSTPYGIADTAACDLEYLIIED